MKYSEAIVTLDALLEASREQLAAMTGTDPVQSYATDSGVLMSHLAIAMTEYPQLAADVERAVAHARKTVRESV